MKRPATARHVVAEAGKRLLHAVTGVLSMLWLLVVIVVLCSLPAALIAVVGWLIAPQSWHIAVVLAAVLVEYLALKQVLFGAWRPERVVAAAPRTRRARVREGGRR
ncbi:hypothetical protein N8J89_12795 [Crossiella sp. CA-258035]|uniref:hypothetical protein n=1 Tax=Crossiella sp. CA-258035 TaxID=2981138 RepID=UPI0024BC1254|nr:hypothetical protein [Crossiella sp. CA-258035]WHT21898.1 hypothetical protein N8J89_12795 [Crossiella sp. CA-258035]